MQDTWCTPTGASPQVPVTRLTFQEHPCPGPAITPFCRGENTSGRRTSKVLEGEWEARGLGGEKAQGVWPSKTSEMWGELGEVQMALGEQEVLLTNFQRPKAHVVFGLDQICHRGINGQHSVTRKCADWRTPCALSSSELVQFSYSMGFSVQLDCQNLCSLL